MLDFMILNKENRDKGKCYDCVEQSKFGGIG